LGAFVGAFHHDGHRELRLSFRTAQLSARLAIAPLAHFPVAVLDVSLGAAQLLGMGINT
jgi:hypothetical protein